MARIKPPKDFKIVGPWMRRSKESWVTRTDLLACASILTRLLPVTRAATRIRLVLSAKKPKQGRRLRFEQFFRTFSWSSGADRQRFLMWGANLYLLRKVRKFNMKSGDTITLWLSAETR